MPKPTLLYASPFPPLQSGISEYSTWLVQELREYFDITLYTGDYRISDPALAEFPVLRHGVHDVPFARFQHKLYNIGNQPSYHGYIYEAALKHPGVVILHEGVLYFLVAGYYRNRADFLSRLYQIGGAYAVSTVQYMLKHQVDPLHFSSPEKLPLNSELLQSGNRLIVHSEYIRSAFGLSAARKINLPQGPPRPRAPRTRSEVLGALHIPENSIVICAPGFVAPTKLNHLACDAIERLHRDGHSDLHLLMIGAGDYVKPYLNDRIHMTGFVSEEEFDDFLSCSDLVLNLRYPTNGETSASLVRAMQFAKPCMVTDIGWFSELPGQVVFKLDASRPELIVEHLYEALRAFLNCREPFERMGRDGREYVRREHDSKAVAAQVRQLLTQNHVGECACAGGDDSRRQK